MPRSSPKLEPHGLATLVCIDKICIVFLRINDKDLIGREPLQNYFASSNPHTKTIIIKRCWGRLRVGPLVGLGALAIAYVLAFSGGATSVAGGRDHW